MDDKTPQPSIGQIPPNNTENPATQANMVAAQPPTQDLNTPAQTVQPAATTTSSTPTQPAISTSKRVVICVFGGLLVLFALSIVQGQVSHGFDGPGVIMILFFGLIGLGLLYKGIFAKKRV